MKKHFFAMFLAGLSTTALSAESRDAIESIVYRATNDFSSITAGDAPYYIDKRSDALGIDARVLQYRGLFAQATDSFEGESGEYDVTITVMTEEDGEPLYRFRVNDEIVGLFRSTHIGKGSARDLKPETHTWRGIKVKKGDIISIESNAHTNGEILEHNGTAWARGRWQTLSFRTASKNHSSQRPLFQPHKDLLIAQFDFQPDADDVQSVAAFGAMLSHEDMGNVNVVAVAGTVGTQDGQYIDANALMSKAFGQKNLDWFDAKSNWQTAVDSIRDRARATLANGGRVWVQEAGQSDFTRDWVESLHKASVHPSVTRNNIVVVQHSKWNEDKTTTADLAFVKENTLYWSIDDGNKPMRVFDKKNRRGDPTPLYVSQDSKYRAAAISVHNSYSHSRSLWQLADKIIENSGFDSKYSAIPIGGVDFSDMVEVWWILNLGQSAISVPSFWQRYVSDVELDRINPPSGRLAIVIDGNSPDPDDIGATPVMLGILQQSNLADRLVHLSHSCDLDPFTNKARWQIDAKNEARRQSKLHELSGKGIELFGPFNNLRDYYNCRTHQKMATQDLVDAINASSDQDPLWIIEAGEPDLIGYALQAADPAKPQYVHVVSHHPANDNSGDYFTWQQILTFGVTEHQIGDQNVGLQAAMDEWDWAKDSRDKRHQFIWEMLAYAEQDGIVPFQTNKFDCSDAGMVYWWLTGANQGGNAFSTPKDMKKLLLEKARNSANNNQ